MFVWHFLHACLEEIEFLRESAKFALNTFRKTYLILAPGPSSASSRLPRLRDAVFVTAEGVRRGRIRHRRRCHVHGGRHRDELAQRLS
jgi:hypothetical protein